MKTLIDYKSLPHPARFTEVSLDRLKDIRAEIIDSDKSATTEWSHDAWESDRKAVDMAVARAEQGQTIYIAQDDDGYYFAIP